MRAFCPLVENSSKALIVFIFLYFFSMVLCICLAPESVWSQELGINAFNPEVRMVTLEDGGRIVLCGENGERIGVIDLKEKETERTNSKGLASALDNEKALSVSK